MLSPPSGIPAFMRGSGSGFCFVLVPVSRGDPSEKRTLEVSLEEALEEALDEGIDRLFLRLFLRDSILN